MLRKATDQTSETRDDRRARGSLREARRFRGSRRMATVLAAALVSVLIAGGALAIVWGSGVSHFTQNPGNANHGTNQNNYTGVATEYPKNFIPELVNGAGSYNWTATKSTGVCSLGSGGSTYANNVQLASGAGASYTINPGAAGSFPSAVESITSTGTCASGDFAIEMGFTTTGGLTAAWVQGGDTMVLSGYYTPTAGGTNTSFSNTITWSVSSTVTAGGVDVYWDFGVTSVYTVNVLTVTISIDGTG